MSAKPEGEETMIGRFGEPLHESGTLPSEASRPRAALAFSARRTVRYEHGDPTPHEQLMLELVNRSRSDPAGEARRLGIDLNEGLPNGTITPSAKPPLALHPLLIDAARAHSEWMLQANVFDHTGAQGSTPGDRMRAAGYPFSGSWTWGENIAWRGTTGQLDVTEGTAKSHDGLFESPGHRENLMNADFQEIGLGVLTGVYTQDGTDFNSVMTTQNFTRSGGTPGPFLLGVVYRDSDGDGAYDVGEGLAGVEVRSDQGDYYAVTSGSGGYALPSPSTAGGLGVTFSGPGVPRAVTKQVVLAVHNVKLDFEVSSERPLLFLTETARLDPDGRFRCEITGPVGANVLIQASPDGSYWVDVDSSVLSASSWAFVDPEAGERDHRLYRAVLGE